VDVVVVVGVDGVVVVVVVAATSLFTNTISDAKNYINNFIDHTAQILLPKLYVIGPFPPLSRKLRSVKVGLRRDNKVLVIIM